MRYAHMGPDHLAQALDLTPLVKLAKHANAI